MSSFFPEEDKFMGNSDYFKPGKLIEGDEVKIRILSAPIVGWENWTEDKKPVRFLPQDKPRNPPNPNQPVKEFTAMVIWNYDMCRVQIWSFGQKNLKTSLKSLAQNKGSPLNYDIFVSRHGSDKDTRYILRAASPCKLPKEVALMSEETPVNLHALYAGKDPFVDLGTTFNLEVSNESSVA